MTCTMILTEVLFCCYNKHTMAQEQLSFDVSAHPRQDHPLDYLPQATPDEEERLARAKELMAEPDPAQYSISETRKQPSSDKDYRQVELDDDAYEDVERGFVNAELIRRRLAGKKAA